MNGIRKTQTSLRVGQTLTVVRWKVPLADGIRFDQSFIGDELELVAIDYPFVKVRLSSVGLEGYIKTLSMDKVELKILDKNFVNIK